MMNFYNASSLSTLKIYNNQIQFYKEMLANNFNKRS